MNLQKKIEDILKEVAKKYNKPYNVILAVYISEFKKLKEEMNSLQFKTVKLPNWGKFIVSQKKLKKIDYVAKEARRNAKYGKDGTKDNKI
jgi:hypothetical protein